MRIEKSFQNAAREYTTVQQVQGSVPVAKNTQIHSGTDLVNDMIQGAERADGLHEHLADTTILPPSIKGLVQMAASLSERDWSSFSQHVQLSGVAGSAVALTTPFAKADAACYRLEVYMLDQNGQEVLVLREGNFDVFTIRDRSSTDAILVDAQSFGGTLLLETVFDEIVSAQELPAHVKSMLGDNLHATGFHIVENAILAGIPLGIAGEVYIRNGIVHIRRYYDGSGTPITKEMQQKQMSGKRIQRIVFSSVIGVAVLVFALIVLLFSAR